MLLIYQSLAHKLGYPPEEATKNPYNKHMWLFVLTVVEYIPTDNFGDKSPKLSIGHHLSLSLA